MLLEIGLLLLLIALGLVLVLAWQAWFVRTAHDTIGRIVSIGKKEDGVYINAEIDDKRSWRKMKEIRIGYSAQGIRANIVSTD